MDVASAIGLAGLRMPDQKVGISVSGEETVEREHAVRPFRNRSVEIRNVPAFHAEPDHMTGLGPRHGIGIGPDFVVADEASRSDLQSGVSSNIHPREALRTEVFGIDALYPEVLHDRVPFLRCEASHCVAVMNFLVVNAETSRIHKAGREDVSILEGEMVVSSQPGPVEPRVATGQNVEEPIGDVAAVKRILV